MTTATKPRLGSEWWAERSGRKLKGTDGHAAVEIWSGPRNLVDAEYVGTVADDAAALTMSAPQLLTACIEAENALTKEIEASDLHDDATHTMWDVRELLRAAIAAATK